MVMKSKTSLIKLQRSPCYKFDKSTEGGDMGADIAI